MDGQIVGFAAGKKVTVTRGHRRVAGPRGQGDRFSSDESRPRLAKERSLRETPVVTVAPPTCAYHLYVKLGWADCRTHRNMAGGEWNCVNRIVTMDQVRRNCYYFDIKLFVIILFRIVVSQYQGPKQEIDALNAYLKLMRAAETVTVRSMTSLPKGLSLTQFSALEALLHCGSMCQTHLAKKLLKSGGNITLVVDNLEKAGWVLRQRDPRDRRFITISLTDKGRTLITGIFPSVAANINRELKILSAAEQFTLGWLCKKLGTQSQSSAKN